MYDDEYDEADGTCEVCGISLDEDPGGDHEPHHRLCWRHWRRQQADDDEEVVA